MEPYELLTETIIDLEKFSKDGLMNKENARSCSSDIQQIAFKRKWLLFFIQRKEIMLDLRFLCDINKQM